MWLASHWDPKVLWHGGISAGALPVHLANRGGLRKNCSLECELGRRARLHLVLSSFGLPFKPSRHTASRRRLPMNHRGQGLFDILCPRLYPENITSRSTECPGKEGGPVHCQSCPMFPTPRANLDLLATFGSHSFAGLIIPNPAWGCLQVETLGVAHLRQTWKNRLHS